MPELSEIGYSRDACVAAVRGYYDFLTKMYLDESDIVEPPEGGWPSITTESLQSLGKTNEVILLLRHLPYLRAANSRALSLGRTNSDELRVCSEDPEISEDVPAHVVGLTSGGDEDTPVFLLDTELGIVHCPGCNDGMRHNPSREPVLDDPYDWAPENEAEWRADAPAWGIADFFEVLKDQFRELHFIPITSRNVVDIWATLHPSADGMVAMVQSIYRTHGWPNLERYRKRECLEAVQKALQERYPGYEEARPDDE
ncbi:hypothetical protein QBC33DRAFT_569894 [Phialemonium atrogriseum]|uniref:Uncharacterized protein n=1 Tax=Phialemonium atrogriseum TaxID=1093897 RepID=A0AAJ0BZV7_9PEZI|nr:uncharacterized protein QBC33DRAFT_569894 [Phialemonium atrogriseum]KAK1767570.1 hypothetical protein QBC33DRAFT_569894 [Phialemonium atrogriseum]